MPRSERLYTFLLVGVMSIIVIVSLVSGIRGLRGDQEVRPNYESAPPSALVPAPDDSIVDVSNTTTIPIADADFLLFHRSTRLLTPLVTDRGVQEARDVVANRRVIVEGQRRLDEFASILEGQRRSPAKGIEVIRPVSRVCDLSAADCERYCPVTSTGTDTRVCARARTNATVTFVRQTGGEPGAPSVVSVDWQWVRTPGGWRVIDINPTLVSSGEDTAIEPSVEESPEEDPLEALPNDPDAPVVSPE